MKTAYSYIRWSTRLQGGQDRDSKTRQTNSARKWIEDYGQGKYNLSDEVFLDAGKSGYKGKHLEVDEYGRAKGELRRFIQLVEEGKIKAGSILLVDDYSRFSRLKPSKSISLFMNVIEAGIGLVFTGSFEKRVINTDLIDKEPYILQFIVGEISRSYAESEERSRKVKLAKQTLFTNIKNGVCQRNNLPPYFSFVPDNGSKSIGHYEHNVNTAVVKELITLFLEGKSLYEIAGVFNAKQLKTFKGKCWSGNGVSKILRNPILKGEHKGIKNFAPPITDEDTFNKIQNRLTNNPTFGKKGDISNIFRGLCFCSECGHTMNVMSNYNPKDRTQKYRYLRCSMTNQKNSTCSNRGVIRLNEMEQDFFFNFIMKSPAQLLTDTDNSEVRELDKQITSATTRLNKLTTTIKETTELVGVVPVDELKVKLTQLNKDRDTIKELLDTLNYQKSQIKDAAHNFHDIQKLFHSTPKNPPQLNDPEAIKEVAKRLVLKVKNGEPMKHKILKEIVADMSKQLEDEYVREGIRVMLPSLIGKITVDTRNDASQFFVFNRLGKLVYESIKQRSNRNSGNEWKSKVREGIKKYWTKKRQMVIQSKNRTTIR